MAGVDCNLLKLHLNKRLALLRQNKDPEEQFRLSKRYLSHFVKLVQIGRIFEPAFAEHLGFIVDFLNNRRKKPLETDTLGMIVKTLCVICCLTAAPFQTVEIALHGLLEIFERISCKEMLQVIKFCEIHFKKLISQFRRFGYFKIQQKLIELAFVASLSFSIINERKEFLLQLGKQIGGPLEQALGWKSFSISKDCRNFINGLQNKFPLMAAYSVPIVGAEIGMYRLENPNRLMSLWVDINFQPATVRFNGRVVLTCEKENSFERTVNLEIFHKNISKIDTKTGTDYCELSIDYTKISFDPEVLAIDQKGSITFKVLPSFDCSYFNDNVIPEVRLNVNRVDNSEPPCTTNLDGLLNVSLLESIVSGPANSLYAHTIEDQSPRLRDNRDAIEKHRNIRCQMLDKASSIDSNKENEKPPSVSDVRVVVQDIHRMRVFESLQQDCQRQIARRNSRQDSTDKRDQHIEVVTTGMKQVVESCHLDYQRQPNRLSRNSRQHSTDECHQSDANPHLSDGKKRKLFVKQAEQDNFNISYDSQIQRNNYVERKLVNTVKPIQTLDTTPLKIIQTISNEKVDLLSESSTSEIMSNDEFDRSLQAFIDHNGIFGIVQQKILDTKLEKNIRKINQMVERTTKKFFKREPASGNPYDFVNTDENKEANRKRSNTGVGARKRNISKAGDGKASTTKKAKNTANESLRTKHTKSISSNRAKKQTPPKKSSLPVPTRVSLPRIKKPNRIIDLESDSEEEAVVIGNTFQNIDISSIDHNPTAHKNPIVKQLFAKYTPIEKAKGQKRSHDMEARKKHDSAFVIKQQRVPLLQLHTNNSNILMRSEYKKSPISSILQKTANAMIEQEQTKEQLVPVSSSVSNHNVSLNSKNSMKLSAKQAPVLTEILVRKHQSKENAEPISYSLEANSSAASVDLEKSFKTKVDTITSKFNLNYAQDRYTLKKFISNDGSICNNEGDEDLTHLETKLPNVDDESVLSENIRVGHEIAHPPSFKDDSIEMHSVKSVLANESHPPKYRAMPAITRPVRPDCSLNTHLKNKSLASITAYKNKPRGSIVQSALPKSPASMDAMMIDDFFSKIHQELNPSLSDFERKVNKLSEIKAAFDSGLSGLQMNGINEKCAEIITLEDKLDELLSELAELCDNAVEKTEQLTAGAEKLARYTESRSKYFKERIQKAHEEIPEIVDECVKSVWNHQVQIRLNQLDFLRTTMLM